MEMTEKDELRALVKEKRGRIDPAEEDAMNEALCRKIAGHPAIWAARCVYLYLDCRHEAGTKRIVETLWSYGIRTAVPRVEGGKICFYRIRSWADVAPGCMGISEPIDGCQKADYPFAPVIVPGLAFDPQGGRVGYGGGYYDRFLSEESGHRTIGLAFDFQIFSRVPAGAADQAVDEIVTPAHHYICKEEDHDVN